MPGATLRRSMAHLGDSQRAPLRYSFMPSRRHSLQTGSVLRAMNRCSRRRGTLASRVVRLARHECLAFSFGSARHSCLAFGARRGCLAYRFSDAPLLRRPAAVVRQRRDVLDGLDVHAGLLKRRDGAFAARTRPLDADLDLFHAELRGPLGDHLGGALGGEGRTLAAALEADRAGGGVAQRVAVGVSHRDDGVVERRLDVGDAPADVAALLAFLALGHFRLAPGERTSRGETRSARPHFPATWCLLAGFFDALLAG